MSKGYINDFYRQFEELNNKMDNLLKENRNQALTISCLKDELQNERMKNEELLDKIDMLLEEIEKLRNQNNKNSSNSSKPSSTDIIKPKKSGANLYNSRVKSNNKPGGKKGHIGASLSKGKIEKLIKDKDVEVIEKVHYINSDDKVTKIKYRIGLKFVPYIERHTFVYDENSKEKLPTEFYTDVTYSNELKSLIVFMNVHNVLSVKRLTEFIDIISNGVIEMSQSTIINIMKEFSNKCTASIDNIISDVLGSKVCYTDETVEKINKKNGYVRNYSDDNSVVYKSHFNKGHNPIKEDGILPLYTGIIMGDHDTTLDSYGIKRIECNVHLGRYTVEITENVFDAPWAEKMKTLLETGSKTREYAKLYGLSKFNDDDYDFYSNKFDQIIEEAKNETKNMKSSFYKKKSKQLYSRLEKNKEKHLAYLKDFSLPYSNNKSESDLRVYKIKVKVSGCFRSKNGSDYFADALSIIKTSIKRKQNIIENILSIFNGETLFA